MRLGLATTAPDRGIERHPYSPEYGLVQHATALRTGLLAAGPSVLAAYVPAADGPRAPRVALVERDGRARAGYVTWTFAIADGVERLVSIAFPSGAAQPANVAEWPQPCIQEARAPCVE
jgi:hypothetical protein